MAAVTAGVSATDTTDNAALTTGSFTPAASDLLLAFAVVSGQAGGGTFTDSQGLGWTQVSTALFSTSADTLVCAVANTLASNAGMTVTFTPAGAPTATGVGISVHRVSGMSRTGTTGAVRQSAKQENQLGLGTPGPAFSVAALTDNPCIGAVANDNNPATLTAPASWTEIHDVGYATPNRGLETVKIDSGFTGTTVTWGGSSPGTTFASMVVELDATVPETITVDKWIGFDDVPALPREPSFYGQWDALTFDQNLHGVQISTDFLRQPADVFCRRPQVQLGGSAHVIEESFFPRVLDWLREPETPRWAKSRSPEGDSSTPWLEQPPHEGQIMDWVGQVPDVVRPQPRPHPIYDAWMFAEFLEDLDWLREAERPRFDVRPSPAIGDFGIPPDPLDPSLVPLPCVESTNVWPKLRPLPTDVGDVGVHSLAMDAIEWAAEIVQPIRLAVVPQPDYFTLSPITDTGEGFADWYVASVAPSWNAAQPMPSGIGVNEPSDLGVSGWLQPSVEMKRTRPTPIIPPSLFVELSTAPESALTQDDFDVIGRPPAE